MRNFVSIDDSNFPIVVSKYHDFIPSPDEFLMAQEDVERFYAAHKNFVLVIDLSQVLDLPSEYRISQAKWAKKNTQLVIDHDIKFSFYTPQLSQQLLVKAAFAISKPGVAYSIASSFDQAYTWAEKQCLTKT